MIGREVLMEGSPAPSDPALLKIWRRAGHLRALLAEALLATTCVECGDEDEDEVLSPYTSALGDEGLLCLACAEKHECLEAFGPDLFLPSTSRARVIQGLIQGELEE